MCYASIIDKLLVLSVFSGGIKYLGSAIISDDMKSKVRKGRKFRAYEMVSQNKGMYYLMTTL